MRINFKTFISEKVNDSLFKTGYEKKKVLDNGRFLLATCGICTKGEPESNQFIIRVYDENKPLPLGHVTFLRVGDHLEAQDVVVQPKFRRQGLATEMYKFARELGNTIKKSNKLTPLGQAFWSKEH